MVGSKDGQLYHIWQSERDGSWSDWEALGHLPSGQLVSQPTLAIDENGWWQAYAVSISTCMCSGSNAYTHINGLNSSFSDPISDFQKKNYQMVCLVTFLIRPDFVLFTHL